MFFISDINKALKMMVINALPPNSLIAFDNKQIDPSGRDIYFRYSFYHSINEQRGKCFDSEEVDEGFIQVSCYVPKNTQDTMQLRALDELKAYFKKNSREKIEITEMNMGSRPRSVESWSARDLTIYWRVN